MLIITNSRFEKDKVSTIKKEDGGGDSFTKVDKECWENTDRIQKGAPPSSALKNGAPPFQFSPESDLDFHVELYELHIMICLGRPRHPREL